MCAKLIPVTGGEGVIPLIGVFGCSFIRSDVTERYVYGKLQQKQDAVFDALNSKTQGNCVNEGSTPSPATFYMLFFS
jgi:hypothetical protein